jgi:undecaprenyl-diphosphatase
LFIDRLFEKSSATPIVNANEEEISYKKSFFIGCFQVLSILFPGLSRSAATIIGGMSQKLTKKAALEFSFFLAVPTMLAASAKSTLDVFKTNPEVFAKDNLVLLLIGAIVAFVVAIASVQFLIRIVEKRGFAIFGWYRIVLGITILTLLYTQYLH